MIRQLIGWSIPPSFSRENATSLYTKEASFCPIIRQRNVGVRFIRCCLIIGQRDVGVRFIRCCPVIGQKHLRWIALFVCSTHNFYYSSTKQAWSPFPRKGRLTQPPLCKGGRATKWRGDCKK